MYSESDFIMLSALQHYVFCPRQCALIHLEQAWEENVLTAEGRGLHERAHSDFAETRPDSRRIFSMPVRSLELGISGQCDCVLETADGELMPLEYKRGKPKIGDMDRVQLCSQALCLEEMTGKNVSEGYVYYFKIRKRLHVQFDATLREMTKHTIMETRAMLESRLTPPPVYNTKCKSCSLKAKCMPKLLIKKGQVKRYIDQMLGNIKTDE